MNALDKLGLAIANAGYTWTPEMRQAYEEGIKELEAEALAEQAVQEPVAKTALKNCIYFDSIDFNQTPPYLRYDTGDSTPKENWTIYCDIQEDLRKNGYELTDSDVDHDTVCGDVTPIEAPVRTKDLTDDEIDEIGKSYFDEWSFGFARAVIAADREKNK